MSRTQNDFKIGDTVSLAHGGPHMTVESANGLHIDCVWFGGVDHALILRESFDWRMLNKVGEME